MTSSASPAVRLPRRVLIANRGEIAVRIARTCAAMGIGTVAVHSDVDQDALHVEVCDRAVRLHGAAPADTYLRGDRIVEAALASGADAVHPGYGFLAESAAFAEQVLTAGLLWIGPPPPVIAAMGDKLEAKRRMAAAGVPLLAGAELDETMDAAAVSAAAEAVGYPVMVKAAAGGGGKGMRVVADPTDLHEALAAARREAGGAFGDDRVFLERFVTRPRHVEVQILGDAHGTLVHLFERECSIQRRHQKIVEETPSPGIDPEVRAALCAAAVEAAGALGYVNAGTVEFVVDEALLARRRSGGAVDPTETFAFLEVNTRLQVEHPVTEAVVRARDDATGTWDRIDLVRLQVLVAAGAPLPFAQRDLAQVGHAIEVRLYAERSADGLPAPGRVHAFEPALGEGIRWDRGVRGGDEVSSHYDPMLAKAIAWAPTRPEAAGRLATALEQTLLDATTNRDLLVAVVRDPAFLAGDTTTAFLDERFPTPGSRTPPPSDLAVDQALVVATLHETLWRRSTAGVLPGIPPGFSPTDAFPHQARYHLVDGGAPRAVRYRAAGRDGRRWSVQLATDIPAGFLDADAGFGRERAVQVHAVSEFHLDAELDGHRQRFRIVARPDGARGQLVQVGTDEGWVALLALPRFPVSAGDEVAGASLAPMPGAVAAVAVDVGQQVAQGEVLVTVEAMKMEHRITAARSGTVVEVAVAAGDQVLAGAVLVVVEGPDPGPGG